MITNAMPTSNGLQCLMKLLKAAETSSQKSCKNSCKHSISSKSFIRCYQRDIGYYASFRRSSSPRTSQSFRTFSGSCQIAADKDHLNCCVPTMIRQRIYISYSDLRCRSTQDLNVPCIGECSQCKRAQDRKDGYHTKAHCCVVDQIKYHDR